MTIDDRDADPILAAIATLPRGNPDESRARRARAQCLAALEQQRRAAPPEHQPVGHPPRRLLEHALVLGSSLVFLAGVVYRAAQLYTHVR